MQDQNHEYHDPDLDLGDHRDPFDVQPTRELNIDEMDPANRSLAEALRISFGFLKWAVALLLIVFIGYGCYNEIQEGQIGIRLRFGAAVGKPIQGPDGDPSYTVTVLNPGVHFSWPEPIDRIIVVPTREQTVTIDSAFFFLLQERESHKPLTERTLLPGGLLPGRDGYLLTADRNIVHGQWAVTFRIDPADAELFALNLGSEDLTESLQAAHDMVSRVAQCAILQVVATITADDFMEKQTVPARSIEIAQQMLDDIGCGITITNISHAEAHVPPSVRDSFNRVTQANAERKRLRDEAISKENAKLQNVAGAGYPVLLEAMRNYQDARILGESARIESTHQQIDALLTDNQSMSDNAIGGRVAEVISAAIADRTGMVQRIESDVNNFRGHYSAFGDDPVLRRIKMQRLWYDTLDDIFAEKHELFRLPTNAPHLIIEIGRNPEIKQRIVQDDESEE